MLVLDPSLHGRQYAYALTHGGWEQRFKRGVHTLRMKDYQIVYCDGLIASPAERRSLQNISAIASFQASEVNPNAKPQRAPRNSVVAPAVSKGKDLRSWLDLPAVSAPQPAASNQQTTQPPLASAAAAAAALRRLEYSRK